MQERLGGERRFASLNICLTLPLRYFFIVGLTGRYSLRSRLTRLPEKSELLPKCLVTRFTTQVHFPYLFYPAWSVRAASSFVALA
jgi:hypothetical protein